MKQNQKQTLQINTRLQENVLFLLLSTVCLLVKQKTWQLTGIKEYQRLRYDIYFSRLIRKQCKQIQTIKTNNIA